MLLTIATAQTEPSFLDYLCSRVHDFESDRVMMLLIEQCDQLKKDYENGDVSTQKYTEGYLLIMGTVRSRPLGQRAMEEYLKNYIKTY